MSTPTRMLLIAFFLLMASRTFGQVATPVQQAEDREASNTYTTRDQLTGILRGSPSELGTILALDPTLLSNEPFLAGYPSLAKFVAEHPEVKRNPRFYLAEFPVPGERRNTTASDILEGLTVLGTMALVAFALSWLVRTTIEQKRWNRLSRTQNEVHNKILDRFSSSEELLAYIRSPAGTRFLESAPIPLHSDPQQVTQNAPFARIMWSIQLGVIIVAGALGMLLVSLRLDAESAQGIFAMGVIALFVGLGFIASAAVSIILPRKLGMTPQPGEPTPREMIG